MNRGFKRAGWVLLVAACLALGCVAAVAKLSIEGERAMARSDTKFDHGQLRESVLFARRAAALYAPGLGHVRRADARLAAIASGAEATQRREIAILAWQAIRASEQQRLWGDGGSSDRCRLAEGRLAVLLADGAGRGSLVEQQQFARQVRGDLAPPSRFQSLRRVGAFLALATMTIAIFAAGAWLGAGGVRRRWLWSAVSVFFASAVAWAILLLLA